MSEIRQVVQSMSFDLRAISELAENAVDCLRSDLGSVNYPIPKAMRDIMASQSSLNKFSYAPTLGTPELLTAIESFEHESFAQFNSPVTLVTSGAQAALFSILFSVLNPGDAILTDSVYYPPYKNIAQLLNSHLITADLNHLTAIDENKIKVLLLNSPHNPTGKCYNRAELQKLAALARSNNWIVIEDAVYNRIYFNEKPASISEFYPERTFVVNSVSKNLCVPGMRVGWIIGESKLVLEVAKMHRNMNSCPNSFFQAVLAEYLPQSGTYFEGLRAEMKERMHAMTQIFDILGWSYEMPSGAIYSFVQVPHLNDGYEFVKRLINEQNVSAMPGNLFGNHPTSLRFCFGSLTKKEIHNLGQRLINPE